MSRAQLPNRGGFARYVPPDDWNPTERLPRGPQNGYVDNKGNEWVRGPSRTAGQPFEWDVQLPDGRHLNVSLDGKITHGLNLNGKSKWP
jgi:filamentous hemagglutinin